MPVPTKIVMRIGAIPFGEQSFYGIFLFRCIFALAWIVFAGSPSNKCVVPRERPLEPQMNAECARSFV